jgi:hypothetical protein
MGKPVARDGRQGEAPGWVKPGRQARLVERPAMGQQADIKAGDLRLAVSLGTHRVTQERESAPSATSPAQ